MFRSVNREAVALREVSLRANDASAGLSITRETLRALSFKLATQAAVRALLDEFEDLALDLAYPPGKKKPPSKDDVALAVAYVVAPERRIYETLYDEFGDDETSNDENDENPFSALRSRIYRLRRLGVITAHPRRDLTARGRRLAASYGLTS